MDSCVHASDDVVVVFDGRTCPLCAAEALIEEQRDELKARADQIEDLNDQVEELSARETTITG